MVWLCVRLSVNIEIVPRQTGVEASKTKQSHAQCRNHLLTCLLPGFSSPDMSFSAFSSSHLISALLISSHLSSEPSLNSSQFISPHLISARLSSSLLSPPSALLNLPLLTSALFSSSLLFSSGPPLSPAQLISPYLSPLSALLKSFQHPRRYKNVGYSPRKKIGLK